MIPLTIGVAVIPIPSLVVEHIIVRLGIADVELVPVTQLRVGRKVDVSVTPNSRELLELGGCLDPVVTLGWNPAHWDSEILLAGGTNSGETFRIERNFACGSSGLEL